MLAGNRRRTQTESQEEIRVRRFRPNNNKTVFVGIDMSLTRPGICIGTSSDNYSCISKKMPEGKKFPHPVFRYSHISDKIIASIIDYSKMKNLKNGVVIVMEDYAYGASGHTFAIAENGGIFKYNLIMAGFPIHTSLFLVSTGHLKMFVTGNGQSPKDIMIKEVYKKWGFDTSSNDEADAFSLWKIGMALNGRENTTIYQEGILKKIREYNGKKSRSPKKKAKI